MTCLDDADARLGHDEARAAYLTAAFALNDATHMADALAAVARVRGLDVLAAATGLPLARLQAALASDAMPDMPTFVAVLAALGLRLRVEAVSAAESPAA